MYTVTVREDFVARHFLTVPSPPPGEGEPHSHHYELELTFAGPELNEFDYLVDIDDVAAALSDLRARYGDALLNDDPAFEGFNPSVERFARVVHRQVAEAVTDETITELAVTVWEDEDAAAAYEAAV
jgi:6-pyruvoyltetrahydropterin/6-carboxytetrahydropterin synthase